MSTTSVAENLWPHLAVPLLPSMQAEPESSLLLTRDRAAQHLVIPTKVESLTVHRAHLEQGILRRLL